MSSHDPTEDKHEGGAGSALGPSRTLHDAPPAAHEPGSTTLETADQTGASTSQRETSEPSEHALAAHETKGGGQGEGDVLNADLSLANPMSTPSTRGSQSLPAKPPRDSTRAMAGAGTSSSSTITSTGRGYSNMPSIRRRTSTTSLQAPPQQHQLQHQSSNAQAASQVQSSGTAAGGGPTPTPANRNLKDIEADVASYVEELNKFKKSVTAQRSPQWLLDELLRIQNTRTDTLITNLLNDARNYSRIIDNQKRTIKGLKDEFTQLKESLERVEEVERPRLMREHAAELSARDQKIAELQARLDAQEEELRKTRETLQREKDEAERTSFETLRKTDETIVSLKTTIEEMRTENSALASKILNLEEKLMSVNSELNIVTAERNSVKRELEVEQQNADELAKAYREMQSLVTALKPWEVRYLTMEKLAQQTEEALVERASVLKRNNDSLRKAFKFLFIKLWYMFLRTRVMVSGARAKVNALILATESEVEKLRAVTRPGAPSYSSSIPMPATFSGPTASAKDSFPQFSTNFSSLHVLRPVPSQGEGSQASSRQPEADTSQNTIGALVNVNSVNHVLAPATSDAPNPEGGEPTQDDLTWHRALELAIARKRNLLRQDLVNLKKVSCWELFRRLTDEISNAYEPVLELVRRARKLGEACDSLATGSITLTTQKLKLEEECARLSARLAQTEKMCETLALERDRERQTAAALNLRLAAVGKESITQRRTRKQARIVEEVLKQQGKLCSLKDLLVATKQRIKLLKEARLRQHEMLETLIRKKARDSTTIANLMQQKGLTSPNGTPARLSLSRSTSYLMALPASAEEPSGQDPCHAHMASNHTSELSPLPRKTAAGRNSFSMRQSASLSSLHLASPRNSFSSSRATTPVPSYMSPHPSPSVAQPTTSGPQAPFQPLGVDPEDEAAVENVLRDSLVETIAFASDPDFQDPALVGIPGKTKELAKMSGAGQMTGGSVGETDPSALADHPQIGVESDDYSDRESHASESASVRMPPITVKKKSELERARIQALEMARERAAKAAEAKAFWGNDNTTSIKDLLHERYVAEKLKARQNQRKQATAKTQPRRGDSSFHSTSAGDDRLAASSASIGGHSKPREAEVAPNAPHVVPPAQLKPLKHPTSKKPMSEAQLKRLEAMAKIYAPSVNLHAHASPACSTGAHTLSPSRPAHPPPGPAQAQSAASAQDQQLQSQPSQPDQPDTSNNGSAPHTSHSVDAQ